VGKTTMISRSWAPLLLIVLVLSCGAGAQQRNQEVLLSHSTDGQLVVQIRQASKLYPILLELCQQIQAECDITASSSSEAMLVPMTVVGNWTQIVEKLLEGTEFNFAAINPTHSHESARLVIQNKPTGIEPPSHNPVAPGSMSSTSMTAPAMPNSASMETTPAAQENGPDNPTDSSTQQPVDVLARFLSGANNPGNEAVSQSPIGPPLPGIPPQAAAPPGPPLPGIPVNQTPEGSGPLGPFPRTQR